jgi:hypothetical protein
MEWYIYSGLIASVMFAYIQMFVRNMQAYKNSDYTMTWGEFVDHSMG